MTVLNRTIVEVEGRQFAVEVIDEQTFVLELVDGGFGATATVLAQVPRLAVLAMAAAVDEQRARRALQRLREFARPAECDTPVVEPEPAPRCAICRANDVALFEHNGRLLCALCRG